MITISWVWLMAAFVCGCAFGMGLAGIIVAQELKRGNWSSITMRPDKDGVLVETKRVSGFKC